MPSWVRWHCPIRLRGRLDAVDYPRRVHAGTVDQQVERYPSIHREGVRTAKRRVTVVGLIVAVVILAGCDENLSPFAFVRNEAGQAIDVYEVVDGQEQLLVSLDKPLGALSQELFGITNDRPDECSRGDLVARTKDGVEVARLTEAICIQQLWVIEKDGSSHLVE